MFVSLFVMFGLILGFVFLSGLCIFEIMFVMFVGCMMVVCIMDCGVLFCMSVIVLLMLVLIVIGM